MTVNTTNITSGPYTGNGVTTQFQYTFRIEKKSQVRVFETTDTGIETELVVDTNYTVADIGVDGGGLITRAAGALPLNYTWFIRSNYEETQLTAFDSQGGFFPETHEDAMDKLTFLIQQLLDKQSRSPTISESYSGTLPLSLPDPEAGKLLKWLGDLSGFENTDVSQLSPGLINDDQALFGFATLAEAVASVDTVLLKAGRTIYLKERTTGNGGGALWNVVLLSTVTPNVWNIVVCVGIPTLALSLVLDGVVPAKAIGCMLDNVTDDFLPFTHLYCT